MRWSPTGAAATNECGTPWRLVAKGPSTSCFPTSTATSTERQLPVARFSLWAHLRALRDEGRAAAADAGAGGDTIESRWTSTPQVS